MRFTRYLRLERHIAASDTGGILERWRFGARLLADGKMTTPAGNLRHGVLARLIAEAKADGHAITEQEIQRRLRCARTYRSEAEIHESAHGFRNWDELARAGFPPVQVTLEDDTDPFDPRDPDEKRRDAARELARLAEEEGAGQIALFEYFPADQFDSFATLADLRKYAEESAEWTERHVRKDQERFNYLARLLGAVKGDESKTWAEAQAALDAT
jgi:hypothetical protein